MKVFKSNKWLLLLGATMTGYAAHAQVPTDPAAVPAFRSASLNAVFTKVQKSHFSPRPMDDAYAASVWKNFIQTLDPYSYIFLQEDLDRLASYKQTIDEELNTGSTAFFDAAMAIYKQRLQETEALYRQLIATTPDFKKQEAVITWRRELPFPANKEERADLWRKLIKHGIIRNYQEMAAATGDSSKIKGPMDAALEKKATEKVKKYYEAFFRKNNAGSFADDMFTQYIAVALLEIDPHTGFSGPKDKSFSEALNRRYYGLGIELGVNELDYYVKRLMPGGSAFRSGVVKENDNILAISDVKGEMLPVSGLEATEVAGMIRGEKGTEVKLTLQQPGEKSRVVAVKRDEVVDTENKSKSAIIEKDGKKFGYIYLPMFYTDESGKGKGCANDVAAEVEKLNQNEVDGIIMDLRSNGGGSLEEVVRMGYCFVPGGPFSWLREKDKINRYNSPEAPPLYDGPLTVLIDESSASASEIFAAAMQDRGRAIIMGTSSSFGKGTAQVNVNVGKLGDKAKGTEDVNFGSMRLTVQKFYRINGSTTQLKGVIPDIVLQDRMSFQTIMEKDFSSALPSDSVILPPYNRMTFPFNYDAVISNARKRVKNNEAYAKVDDYTKKLKALMQSPTPLDLNGYRKQNEEVSFYKNGIQQAKELPASQRLNVSAAEFRNISPALQASLPAQTPGYKDFLERVKKDIYITESISVLEDIIKHPKQ